MEEIKNCNNCAHRVDGRYENYGKCMLSGYYCSTTRTSLQNNCDRNFSGWVKRVIINL